LISAIASSTDGYPQTTSEDVSGSAVLRWTLGIVALGVLVYRPWQPIPFDITDFSELLPLLTGSDSSLGRLDAIVSYYFGHGRSYVVTSGFIWIQWELFGSWAVGWRLFRALLFCILIWTFLRTATRFGLPLLPAGLGGSLFVLSWPAAEGWLRLTGEPLAAVFFLVGLGIAARYHTSPLHLRTALLLALVTAAMLLTKETMIVCVPALFLVAASWRGEGGFQIPELDRRTLLVGVTLTLTLLALALFIFLISHRSGPEAYARVYGTAPLTLSRLGSNLLAILWPFGGAPRVLSPLGAFASVLVLFGCLLAIRNNPTRGLGTGLLFLLSICLLGAAVYLPWKRFEPHYPIPFLVGPAGILAIGACGLAGRSRIRAVLTTGSVLLILLPSVLHGIREASFREAERLVNWKLAEAVHAVSGPADLVFAVLGLPDQAWQGRGATLSRYADVVFGGRSSRSPIDQTCRQVAGRLGETPTRTEITISYHHWCGALLGPKTTISREVRTVLPGELKLGTVRVSADILVRNPPTDETPSGESQPKP